MSELQTLKKQLEEKLAVINEAIKIQDEWNEPSGDDRPKVLKPDEIEGVIIGMEGDFTRNDVQTAIKAKFGRKAVCSASAISSALYMLFKAKELDYARERSGRRPAIYRKVSRRK